MPPSPVIVFCHQLQDAGASACPYSAAVNRGDAPVLMAPLSMSARSSQRIFTTPKCPPTGLVPHILVSHEVFTDPSNDPVHHSPSFTNTLQTSSNSVHKLWENGEKQKQTQLQKLLEKCKQNVTSLHLGQLHKGQCARHALHLTQLFYFLLKLGPRHPFWRQRIVFLEAPGELWEKSIRKGICMHSLLSEVSMKFFCTVHSM